MDVRITRVRDDDRIFYFYLGGKCLRVILPGEFTKVSSLISPSEIFSSLEDFMGATKIYGLKEGLFDALQE